MSVADPLIQVSLLGEAVDNGPVAVFVVDEDCRFVAANRAACALVAYEREDLLALSTSAIVDGESRFDEIREHGVLNGTATLRRRDGSTVAYTYTAGATVVAGMPVYVSVGSGS
jgi:PAS domain S-box-containing protein